MKIEIPKNQILYIKALLEAVESLYESKPGAYLLHTDFESKEGSFGSLYLSGNFSVAVTSVIKIDLYVGMTFTQGPNPKKHSPWKIESCTIRHDDSETSIQMPIYNGKPCVWSDSCGRGEFLKLIGATP
jgi:hypothetical protein